jgi:hypothetical protein
MISIPNLCKHVILSEVRAAYSGLPLSDPIEPQNHIPQRF